MQVTSCFEGLFKGNTAVQLKFEFDWCFENYSFLRESNRNKNTSPWTTPMHAAVQSKLKYGRPIRSLYLRIIEEVK